MTLRTFLDISALRLWCWLSRLCINWLYWALQFRIGWSQNAHCSLQSCISFLHWGDDPIGGENLIGCAEIFWWISTFCNPHTPNSDRLDLLLIARSWRSFLLVVVSHCSLCRHLFNRRWASLDEIFLLATQIAHTSNILLLLVIWKLSTFVKGTRNFDVCNDSWVLTTNSLIRWILFLMTVFVVPRHAAIRIQIIGQIVFWEYAQCLIVLGCHAMEKIGIITIGRADIHLKWVIGSSKLLHTLRVFLTTHKSFHQVFEKTVLFLLGFDQVSDTRDVFRSAENVAHEHV